MNRKIIEVVNSEDNGLRSFIGYITYKGVTYVTKSNGGIKNEIK